MVTMYGLKEIRCLEVTRCYLVIIKYDLVFAKCFLVFHLDVLSRSGGAAVAEWLSSWLAEQEVRGSIPGFASRIFRDWLSPASKSRYGWKIAKSTLILKTTNQLSRSGQLVTKRCTYSSKIKNELMHCHCDTNNREPRWTFTDPWKPEVRPGAREESAVGMILCLATSKSHLDPTGS